MNRKQAIQKATHLRKGMDVFVKSSADNKEFKSISEAKRFSRSLGLTCVALREKETFDNVGAV